ncbi:hypothetical protein BDQ12DRAFT_668287 [Crucibulum laeve]|uniref:Uncharacterized protein n=1 Tax=Crucibulum laeve TaxID=68775 RepID=A0A5C3LU81_9AGAR|nr:hypothetical protein BDQ12DRAFT_668287 [Crucibulum laeve]
MCIGHVGGVKCLILFGKRNIVAAGEKVDVVILGAANVTVGQTCIYDVVPGLVDVAAVMLGMSLIDADVLRQAHIVVVVPWIEVMLSVEGGKTGGGKMGELHSHLKGGYTGPHFGLAVTICPANGDKSPHPPYEHPMQVLNIQPDFPAINSQIETYFNLEVEDS